MSPDRWAERFEKACRRWQTRLGLLDWNFNFERAKGDGDRSADVTVDWDAREAVLTAYLFAQRDKPERIAFHEVLHVLLADVLEMAARRSDPSHADVLREEHRVIERLLNAIDGRP